MAKPRVGGLSYLKGALIWVGVLGFAILYIDFGLAVLWAPDAKPPIFSESATATGAALSGGLATVFALAVGVPPPEKWERGGSKLGRMLITVISVAPVDGEVSWPLTLGIWIYAGVALFVAGVYILNPNETPASLGAIAVNFIGCVTAIILGEIEQDGPA